mmetsp:Transcript_50479/g.110396  ORF Transcript_50479/g.110396 Transcript_50479/m.110396 type:complete len:449 (+) Transcript_50479:180-1526(+)
MSAIKSISTQVAQLVGTSTLAVDELTLMYSFKHGSSLEDAVVKAGFKGIGDFLDQQKGLAVQNGKVVLADQDSAVAKSIEVILLANGGEMPVTELCAKYIMTHDESLSSVVGMRPAEFLKSRPEFLLQGRGLVGLTQKPEKIPPSTPDPTPAAADNTQAKRDQPKAHRIPAFVSTADKDEDALVELDLAIAARSFAADAVRAVDAIVAVLSGSCLNVSRVVRGGAVGKGLTSACAETADLWVMLEGIPATSWKWESPLLKTAADVYAEAGMTTSINSQSLQVTYEGFTASLRFAPARESYAEALGAVETYPTGPCQRCLAPEQVEFVARQARPVKRTIRLLQWWCDQQEWSAGCKPTAEVLELIAIFVHHRTCPEDQTAAIGGCLTLMANFKSAKIVWTNHYSKAMIPPSVLRQRPLLMDVADPTVNRALEFDYSEMITKAGRTHFFW